MGYACTKSLYKLMFKLFSIEKSEDSVAGWYLSINLLYINKLTIIRSALIAKCIENSKFTTTYS